MKIEIVDCSKKDGERNTVRDATEEEVSNIIELQKVSYDYKSARAIAYPPVGDQLDAIWKEINTRKLSGDAVCDEANLMLMKILDVKSTYKKE